MARKLFTHGISVGLASALALGIALSGCATASSPTAVCDAAYSIQVVPGVSMQGNGSQLFTVQGGGPRSIIWTARVIPGHDKATIMQVLAGSDADHLISYGDFRPVGVNRATIPRQQAGNLSGEVKGLPNRLVYICGESGAEA